MNPLYGAVLSPVLFLPGIILRFLPFKNIVTEKQKRLLTATNAVLLLIHAAVYYFVGTANGVLNITFLKLDMIIFALILTLINMMIIRNRIREHLFTYGLTMLLNYLNLTLTILFSNIFSKILPDIKPFVFYIIFYLIFYIIVFPLSLKLLNITVTPFLSIDSGNYWSTIWFVPTAMFLACYFTVYGEETIDSLPPIIGRLFLMASAFFVCLGVAGDYMRMQEQIITKKQLSMQTAFYDELSHQVIEARRSRHDMKHHIAAIQGFIDNDDKDGLRNYCNEFFAVHSTEIIPYTGNAAADGVLYHYSRLAAENNIEFSIKGIIKSNGIADIDLCSILGNTLDNAISGCLTLESGRRISVLSESNEYTLSVMVVNTFDGVVEKKGDTLMSRKEDGRVGIGLTSMQAVTQKYNGSMAISHDDNEFKVIFILQMEK